MRVWDYFMRRKALLVAIVLFFGASGFLTGVALKNLPITNISTSENAVETQPDDADTVSLPENDPEIIQTESAPADSALPFVRVAFVDAASEAESAADNEEDEVGVPLTGGESFVWRWRSIVAVTTLAVLVLFLVAAVVPMMRKRDRK